MTLLIMFYRGLPLPVYLFTCKMVPKSLIGMLHTFPSVLLSLSQLEKCCWHQVLHSHLQIHCCLMCFFSPREHSSLENVLVKLNQSLTRCRFTLQTVDQNLRDEPLRGLWEEKRERMEDRMRDGGEMDENHLCQELEGKEELMFQWRRDAGQSNWWV